MIQVWTDGCCKGNPGPGGAGVVIVLPDGSMGRIGRPLGATTNNRAELLAVRIALEALAAHSHESMTIHTDSQNVIGWLTDAFRVHANGDLVREIQDCLREFASVSFVKVRGHSGDPNNEAADRLAQHAAAGVTWIQSYFSTDNKKSYCIYDGPTPEAIRKVAVKNRLPVNRITEVRVLDPYFYRAA